MKQSLTEYLMEYVMSVEMTTDDLLPEIYADWITTCDPELIVELAEKWHKQELKKLESPKTVKQLNNEFVDWANKIIGGQNDN